MTASCAASGQQGPVWGGAGWRMGLANPQAAAAASSMCIQQVSTIKWDPCPYPTCSWEPVHCRGNLPAPLAEMGVAVDPRGTVYIAGGW